MNFIDIKHLTDTCVTTFSLEQNIDFINNNNQVRKYLYTKVDINLLACVKVIIFFAGCGKCFDSYSHL